MQNSCLKTSAWWSRSSRFVENGYPSLRFPNMVKMNIHEHWTRVTRFNPLWVSDDTHSKGKNMSFTRKMFRILTKRILTCLLKKRGLFSILVQNSPKVTNKVLVFRKVARSCSLTKKLLRILKVAKKLPSRIWKGLVNKWFLWELVHLFRFRFYVLFTLLILLSMLMLVTYYDMEKWFLRRFKIPKQIKTAELKILLVFLWLFSKLTVTKRK